MVEDGSVKTSHLWEPWLFYFSLFFFFSEARYFLDMMLNLFVFLKFGGKEIKPRLSRILHKNIRVQCGRSQRAEQKQIQ